MTGKTTLYDSNLLAAPGSVQPKPHVFLNGKSLHASGKIISKAHNIMMSGRFRKGINWYYIFCKWWWMLAMPPQSSAVHYLHHLPSNRPQTHVSGPRISQNFQKAGKIVQKYGDFRVVGAVSGLFQGGSVSGRFQGTDREIHAISGQFQGTNREIHAVSGQFRSNFIRFQGRLSNSDQKWQKYELGAISG